MVVSRWLEVTDKDYLEGCLARDEYHKDTPVDFFYQPGTVCNVYEIDDNPVMFVRGTKALRLDIQFVDNKDTKRNIAVMLEGFPKLIEQAQANGFTEIIFDTTSPALRVFCKRRFKFEQVGGELRKFI